MRGCTAASFGYNEAPRMNDHPSTDEPMEPMWLGDLKDRPVKAGILRGAEGQLLVIETFELGRTAFADVTHAFRTLGALEHVVHPNVARILATRVEGEQLIVTSGYLEGESLSTVFFHAAGRAMRVPIDVGCRVVVDVLAGLSALHGLRDAGGTAIDFAHGEVCPRNIIVGVDGRSRIVHACRPGHSPADPRPPALPYAAPETLAHGTMSPAADVYGVGALLFHMLDGGPPFEANKAAITAAHANGAVPRARLPVDEAMWDPLVAIAARAMATDPVRRYASVSEMAGEIRRAVTTRLASVEHTSIVLYDLCGGAIRRRRTRVSVPPRA